MVKADQLDESPLQTAVSVIGSNRFAMDSQDGVTERSRFD